jgi:hypothetical protein
MMLAKRVVSTGVPASAIRQAASEPKTSACERVMA